MAGGARRFGPRRINARTPSSFGSLDIYRHLGTQRRITIAISVLVLLILIPSCATGVGEPRQSPGTGLTLHPLPTPTFPAPTRMTGAIAGFLGVARDAVDIYTIRDVSDHEVLVVLSWEELSQLTGGLARLRRDKNADWAVVDINQFVLPSREVDEGFSAIVPSEIGSMLALGGFVDPTATRVELLGAGEMILDSRVPDASAVVLLADRGSAYQIRLERESQLLAGTSIPLTNEIPLPQEFASNPPDWTEQARAFVDEILEDPTGAAESVYPGRGGSSFVEKLRPLLAQTPHIETITGKGGSYILDLSGTDNEAVLFFYLAPSDGRPKIIGYDYRVR